MSPSNNEINGSSPLFGSQTSGQNFDLPLQGELDFCFTKTLSGRKATALPIRLLNSLGEKIKSCASSFSNGIVYPIKDNLRSAAYSTHAFIQDNWKNIFGVFLGWGIIVLCSGFLYGFSATALPVSVGITCGLSVGILSGVIVVKCVKKYDPQRKYREYYTIAGGVQTWSSKLGMPTKTLVTSVAVAVSLMVLTAFPYPTGAFVGVVLGNFLAVSIGFYLSRPSIDDHIEEIKKEIKHAEKDLRRQRNKADKLLETLNRERAKKKELSFTKLHALKVKSDFLRNELLATKKEIKTYQKTLEKWEARANKKVSSSYSFSAEPLSSSSSCKSGYSADEE